MGSFLARILQVAFAAILANTMIGAVGLMKLIGLFGLSKVQREGYCLMLIQLAWRLSLWLSPWIHITQCESDDWSEAVRGTDVKISKGSDTSGEEKVERPMFLLGNHTSFFDTLFSVTQLPQSVLWHMRTYMKSTLFDLPVLGTACRCIGHFSVHFKGSDDGKFTVDEEKMKIEDGKVSEHLDKKGWLCFFPEGQLNKDPDKLMPFRYGSIQKALDYDAKLVALVTVGNAKVWPLKAAVGGFPGRLTYSVKVLTPDGCRAFVAKLRKQAEAKNPEQVPADKVLLANAMRDLMQQEYDKLKLVHDESAGSAKVKSG